MEPILQLPPGLPPHRAAPQALVATRVIAEWPQGTFLENLAVLDNGDIAVSVLSEARIDRATLAGSVSTLIQLAAPPTGLAMLDGALYAAVGEPGGAEPVLWRIDPQTGAGAPHQPIAGAIFANGMTPFDSHRLLVSDSWQGRLYLVDTVAGTTEVWAEDELLTRAPGVDFLPGANGVKRWHDRVLVASNGRALLIEFAVRTDGSAGAAQIVAEQVRVDDLAFDTAGNAYLTTHIGHSLDRLGIDGARVTLAGANEGLAGSTACAFGRHDNERKALYVSTTGGIVLPVDGILQAARLVRLDLDVEGYPLTGTGST